MLNSWFPAIVYSPQYLLRKDGIYSMHELIAIPIVTVQLKNYLMNRLAFTSSKSTMETPICTKLTVKTPERGHCGRSYVFIVNFEQISHMILLF